MRTTTERLVLILAVIAAGCTSAQSSHEYVEMKTDDLYISVIEYLHSMDRLSDAHLVYVVEPSLGEWVDYCGTKESPDWESAELVGAPCDVFWSIDNDQLFEYPLQARSEIEQAFSSSDVHFARDKTDVLEDGGPPPRPIKDGAALVSLGVGLEVNGKIYLPVDMHGSGVLLEATQTESGWAINSIRSWQA